MSDTINQTVTLAVMAIVSGTNSRRTEFSARVGLSVEDSSTFETVGIASNSSVSYGAYTQMFGMMSDEPVDVSMVIDGVTVDIDQTTMLVMNCSFTSVTITNSGSVTAHLRVALVS